MCHDSSKYTAFDHHMSYDMHVDIQVQLPNIRNDNYTEQILKYNNPADSKLFNYSFS